MAAALDSICRREKMRGRERRKERREKERGRCAGPSSHVPGAPSPFQALVVQGGVDGNNLDSSLRPELRRLLKSSEAPRTRGVGRRPQELTPPPEDLLSFAAPSDALNSSVPAHGEQRAKRELLKPKIYSFQGCNCRHKQFCWWSKPSSIVVILVSLHGAAAWRGGQRRTCETTINTSDANTPRWKNCIRQTVYDIVGLDYEKVTVLIDATAAARPDIHLASIRDMRTIGVETPTLEEWRR